MTERARLLRLVGAAPPPGRHAGAMDVAVEAARVSAQDDHRPLPARDAVARCGGVHLAAVTRCPHGLRCTRALLPRR
jgi:hypothetical protein